MNLIVCQCLRHANLETTCRKNAVLNAKATVQTNTQDAWTTRVKNPYGCIKNDQYFSYSMYVSMG